MNTDLSMMNPGTSIQFDAHAMQLQEEREHQEEEDENREELLELLNNASFEDLLDEDDILGGSIHDHSYAPNNTETAFNGPPHPVAPVPYGLAHPHSDDQLDASIFVGNHPTSNPYDDQPIYSNTDGSLGLQHQSDSWINSGHMTNLGLSEYTYQQDDAQYTDDNTEDMLGKPPEYSNGINPEFMNGNNPEFTNGNNPAFFNGKKRQHHWSNENYDDQWYTPLKHSAGELDLYNENDCDTNFNAEMLPNQHFGEENVNGDLYRQLSASSSNNIMQEIFGSQPQFSQQNIYNDNIIGSSSQDLIPNEQQYLQRNNENLCNPMQNESETNFFHPHDQNGQGIYPEQFSHSNEFHGHNEQDNRGNNFAPGFNMESNQVHINNDVQEFPIHYQVEFTGGRSGEMTETSSSSTSVSSERATPIDGLNQGSDNRQLEQLQVLYKARSRQMEEMARELDAVKSESARDIRILKHKLSLVEGEKEGSVVSLKQCQTLLTETRDRLAESEGQLRAADTQISALKLAKESVMKQLQSAEATINGLTQQLACLTNSESLERARFQHDGVVSGIRAKYETEIFSLKNALDEIKSELGNKEDELVRVKADLQRTRTENNEESSGTIARLAKQVESLTQQSSNQEDISILKYQLTQSHASVSFSRDMCKALQEEVEDLKEQLTLYESASRLGVSSLPSQYSNLAVNNRAADDSMTDLGIKKTLNFESPDLSNSCEKPSEMLPLLRAELEKCMVMNRNKRTQVTSLQDEIRSSTLQIEALTARCERLDKSNGEAQAKLSAYESMYGQPGNVSSVVESRLKKDVENLKQENQILSDEIQEVTKRLEEVSSNEAQLNDINRDLNQRIADMVKEFDEDKKLALNKCQQAWTQLNEDSKQRIRCEVMAEWSVEKQAIICEHENLVEQIKNELFAHQKELDVIKTLYVKICEEKDQLRDEMEKEFNDRLTTEKVDLEKKLEKEYLEKLQMHVDNLKADENTESIIVLTNSEIPPNSNLANSNHSQISSDSNVDQENRDKLPVIVTDFNENNKSTYEVFASKDEFDKQLEMQVTLAKSAWFEEQKKGRQAAIDAAVSLAENMWRLNQHRDWDEKLQGGLSETSTQQHSIEQAHTQDTMIASNSTDLNATLVEQSETESNSEINTNQSAGVESNIHTETKHNDEIDDDIKDFKTSTDSSENEKTMTEFKDIIEQLELDIQKRDNLFKILQDASLLNYDFNEKDISDLVDNFIQLTQNIRDLENAIKNFREDLVLKDKKISELRTDSEKMKFDSTSISELSLKLETTKRQLDKKKTEIDSLTFDLEEVKVKLEQRNDQFELVNTEILKLKQIHENDDEQTNKMELVNLNCEFEKLKIELISSKDVSERFKSELKYM